MASWWTVVLILQIGTLWEFTGATLCTDLTKKTCTKSLQVAGTCTSGVCDCVSGFIPTRTGCSGVVVPRISVFPKLGASTESYQTKPIGSGEVLAGGDIKLTCDPNYGDGLFEWTKGTEKVTGKTNSELELTAIDSTKAGAYKCKIKYTTGDFETAYSNPVTISVIENVNTASFSLAPIVVGMPAKAYSGVTIPLACTNLPSGIALTYAWEEDSTVINTATAQTYSPTMSATTKQHRCRITKDSSSTALATIPAQTQYSAQVPPPTVATSIAGVIMSTVLPSDPPRAPQDNPPTIPSTATAKSGVSLTVYCVITDAGLIVPTVTYGWKKGTDILNDASGSPITVNTFTKVLSNTDAGSYTCTVNDGTVTTTSPAVQLNVVTTVIQDVDVIIYPTSPIIGGYALIFCKVNIDDLRKVTYSWKKDGTSIINVTDSALQINSWAAADDGAYECTAHVSLAATVASLSVTGVTLSGVTPLVESGSVTEFGLGNKYTLTCGNAYASPGLSYTWYEGTTVVTGQTSQQYEITAKTGPTTYYCQMTFNGATSAKATGLTITAKSLLGAVVKIGSVLPPATYKPLDGSSVTLTCSADLAAGASGTPTYAWTKGTTTPTSVGSAASYTFTASTATDDTYTCTVTLGSDSKTAAVAVTHSATIQTPTISTTADKYGSPEVESYSEGGNYDLTCETESYNTDLTYVWKKDGNIVGNSRVYQITNANKVSSAGSYVCTVVRGTTTSTDSVAKTITIGEKGKPCQYIDDCNGDQYDDVCVSNRCVCATGYTLQGNTCSGQGIVTISMLLFVLCGLIKLIL